MKPRSSPIMDMLDEQQRAAAACLDGPVLVLAGAGSGKTRLLTCRIALLLSEDKAPAERILAVTFTNKAAQEMKQRIIDMLGEEAERLTVCTFHSFGARLLRRYAGCFGRTSSFSILDKEDSVKLLRRCIEKSGRDPARFQPASVYNWLALAKFELGDGGPWSGEGRTLSFLERHYIEIYRIYEEETRNNNCFDFTDLIVKPAVLFRKDEEILEKERSTYSYILVDEYQDTSRAQYALVSALAAEHRNICAVGDEDQSIYGWRGADIRNILDFEKDYPEAKVFHLTYNYRSTRTIIEAANRLIVHNSSHRKSSPLRSARGLEGTPIRIVGCRDPLEEAELIAAAVERLAFFEGIPLDRIAVFYRTNAQSRPLEQKLLARKIDYRIYGGINFMERREIKDLVSYLKCVANDRDTTSFRRIVNVPRRGIGAKTLAAIEEKAAAEGLSPMRLLLDEGYLPRGKAGKNLKVFIELMEELEEMAVNDEPVARMLERIVNGTGYVKWLATQKTGGDGETTGDYVEELVNWAAEFDRRYERDESGGEKVKRLDLFLQESGLRTDIDVLGEAGPSLALMTAHNAKGLEFEYVFVCGAEEGMFPLHSSLENAAALEEERRLFYVAMTRAKNALNITWCRRRQRWGTYCDMQPSRFLLELPRRLCEFSGVPVRFARAPFAHDSEFICDREDGWRGGFGDDW